MHGTDSTNAAETETERESRERERERDSASNHTDEPVVELITEVQLHASAPQCGAFGRREYAL